MKKIFKKITIIGTGWLGTPLAASLLQQNCQLVMTKQSSETLNDLSLLLSDIKDLKGSFELKAFSHRLLNLGKMNTTDLHELFFERYIIITIPPTPFIREYDAENAQQGVKNYERFIRKIADLAEQYEAKEIIYTSSTSVYGDSSGIIHEALPAIPKTPSARAIVSAEKVLQNRQMPVTILRLAGLIGHGRHPIFSLQGRTNIRSPFNAINLIHIDDVIEAISTIINRSKKANDYQIYNLVSPYHPNRMSYYQSLAKQLNLAIPLFETPRPELKRIIDGGKITELGDFNYKITDLIHAPLHKII